MLAIRFIIEMESLDIIRPPPHAVRLGKLWTEIAGYDKDASWAADRVANHMAQAMKLDTALPSAHRRHSRLWQYLAVAYLAPSGFALAVISALWILRHGI
jgi:hypothetical protein